MLLFFLGGGHVMYNLLCFNYGQSTPWYCAMNYDKDIELLLDIFQPKYPKAWLHIKYNVYEQYEKNRPTQTLTHKSIPIRAHKIRLSKKTTQKQQTNPRLTQKSQRRPEHKYSM